MTDQVSYEVGEKGAPNLNDDPQADVPPPDAPSAAPAPVDLWTAGEASALISAVFNVGVLVYGRDWAAHPAEFAASGTLLAPQLDRWLPKSAGGGLAAMGLGLISVAGELAAATVRRWPLIQRGPEPIWVQRPPAEGPVYDSTAQPAAAAAPAPNGAQTAGSSAGYRMPADLVHVVQGQARPDDSLTGLGM